MYDRDRKTDSATLGSWLLRRVASGNGEERRLSYSRLAQIMQNKQKGGKTKLVLKLPCSKCNASFFFPPTATNNEGRKAFHCLASRDGSLTAHFCQLEASSKMDGADKKQCFDVTLEQGLCEDYKYF